MSQQQNYALDVGYFVMLANFISAAYFSLPTFELEGDRHHITLLTGPASP